MCINSTILGILLVLCNLNISFGSSCTGCLVGHIINIDEEVYDPASGVEQHTITLEVSDISNSPRLNPEPEPRPRRSALKKPKLDQEGVIEKSTKNVSWSPEVGSFHEAEVPRLSPKRPSGSTSKVFRNHRTQIYNQISTSGSDSFIPIISTKPYDYFVEFGSVLDEILMNVPAIVSDLIKINYPGLGNVSVSSKDLAGLVLFANFHHHPIEFFQTSNLLEIFNTLITTFPDCLHLIESMHVDVSGYRIARITVLNGLFRSAFKNSLYYTIEAFFLTFGSGLSVDYYIKESIKSGNMKVFKRFYDESNIISVDKLIAWSINYGNNQVYESFISYESNTASGIKSYFKGSILVHLARHQYHFPGLVEILYYDEYLNFDEALSLSITNGNHQLFKDLIVYDNNLFKRSFNSRVLNALRALYNGKIIEIEGHNLKKEVFRIVVMLDCEDLAVLETFRRALPEMAADELAIHELLQLSIYSKTRLYLKMILKSLVRLKLCYTTNDGGVLCLWDLIKGSKYYKEILIDLMNSPSFELFHAIANPDFPSSLWPEILERFGNQKFFSNFSYKELIQLYGFNGDAYNFVDMVRFDLISMRTWSILDFAILNFNHVAVEHILLSNVNTFNITYSLDLANCLKDLLESNNYEQTHIMANLHIKQAINRDNRLKKPSFFKDDEPFEYLTVQTYVSNLKYSINNIIKRLEN